jgi:hypothetical protein
MYRLFLIGLLCLAGCKSTPTPAPPPTSAVNVVAPGVRVNVMDDGRVMVKQPAGTIDVK